MEIAKRPLFTCLLALSAAVGCEQSAEPNAKPELSAAAAATSAAPPTSAAPQAAASAAPAPSASAGPPAKATTDADPAKVGILPEGVGIAVGKPATDAAVTDSSGKQLTLSSLWKQGPVLLVFYRGGWCPYCNFQLRELTSSFSEFKARGLTPVAISVDSISEAAKSSSAHQLPFPVLSDPELVAHKAFNVLEVVDEATVAKYKTWGIDLERASGQKHHTIGVPSLFLVDQTGKVRWAHADRDYKTRPSTKQVLAALDAAGFKAKPAP